MGKPIDYFVTFAFFVVAFPSVAAAQNPDPPPTVTGTVSNVTRVETWRFFEPYPGAGTNPDYTFVGDRAELGARVRGVRFDLAAAFNYVRLENLPRNAIGPGGLGAGAFYFASSGERYSYQLYLSEATLRAKSRGGRWAVTLGRGHHESGREAPLALPALDALTRDRLGARMVGDFEYSLYQRRFDGVRVDVERPRWHMTGAAFVPTQGGFEESTNLSMLKLQVATGAATYRPHGAASPSAWQAFGHVYRDRREVQARPDNIGQVDPTAIVDVTVAAVGGSYAAVRPTRAGELDTVVWVAGEFGDWYGQRHAAAAVAVEAGHTWTTAPLTPRVRAGYLWASGDDDASDDRHGTFFPMLPSSRRYALSSTYTQMNLRDAFAQVFLEPGRTTLRVELHRLDLASGGDLWYKGSGATAGTGNYFGFSGLPADGATELGTMLEGTIDVPIMRHWSINAYAGHMWGGDVVRKWFAGDRLTYWTVENVIRF